MRPHQVDISDQLEGGAQRIGTAGLQDASKTHKAPNLHAAGQARSFDSFIFLTVEQLKTSSIRSALAIRI